MNLDCTTPKYDQLYARWLKDAAVLLDVAGVRAGDRVLDLCGGTGVVAKAAVERGADVVLLDLAPRCESGPKLRTITGPAEAADHLLAVFLRDTRPFDAIICRQAIGYLDMGAVIPVVAGLLKPEGRFVFNNFNRPRWRARWYRHDGVRFLEASAWVGRRIAHVQARWPVGLDVTVFRWHHHEDLMRQLANHFDRAEAHKSARSTHYICTRGDGGREGL
jgi:SAM-dependent methyltransferase